MRSLADEWDQQASQTGAGGPVQITIPAVGDLTHVLTDVFAQHSNQPQQAFSTITAGQAKVTLGAIAGVAHVLTGIYASVASSAATAFFSSVQIALDGVSFTQLGNLALPASADVKDEYAWTGQLPGVSGDAVVVQIAAGSGAGNTEHLEVGYFDVVALSPQPVVEYSLNGGSTFTALGALDPRPGLYDYSFSGAITGQPGQPLVVQFNAGTAAAQAQHLEVKGYSL